MRLNRGKILNYLHESDFWLVVFSFTLVRLPIAFGHGLDLTLLLFMLVPYVILIPLKIKYLIEYRPKVIFDKRLMWIGIVFWSFELASLIRTALVDDIYLALFAVYQIILYITLGAFFYLALAICSDNQSMLSRIRRAVFYALGVYILVNLVIYFSGVGFQADTKYLIDYPAQMLSTVGLNIYRVLFPMAEGINAFGIVSGLGLVTLGPFVFSKDKSKTKWIARLLAIGSFLAILLTDSRGALFFSVLVILIVFLPSRFFVWARWLPFAISVIPIIIVLLGPTQFAQTLSWLTRPTNDIDVIRAPLTTDPNCSNLLVEANGFLSNRPVIWTVVMDEFRPFQLIDLVGYGYRGQTVSGISDEYSCLFQSYAIPKLASAHNNWLQAIVDIGYLGLVAMIILLFALVIKTASLLKFTGELEYKSMIACLLYIVATGSLEALIFS